MVFFKPKTNKMKKYIAITCAFFVTASAFSQTDDERLQIDENLQKYSDYRHSLEENFVVVSPNDEQGSNIPALSINPWTQTLDFSDGNGSMPYFIGLLATEYALLARTGQDVTHTKEMLNYALNAVDRLDREAESYYRKYGTCSSPLNGFFLRDDVDVNFFSNKAMEPNPKINPDLKDYKCRSKYDDQMDPNYGRGEPVSGCGGNDGNFINSRDMYWNYLLNFALVKGLVNDADIVRHVKDMTYRIIHHLHTGNAVDGTYWVNKNPVTGWYWPGGGDIDGGSEYYDQPIGFCTASQGEWAAGGVYHVWGTGVRWGLFRAGDWITDHTNGDNTYGTLWQSTSDNLITNHKKAIENSFYARLDDGGDAGYGKRACLAVMCTDKDLREHTSSPSVYNYLSKVRDNENAYAHLPLITRLLHGITAPQSDDHTDAHEITFYCQLLNSAPYCGSYDESTGVWSHDNILVWPAPSIDKVGSYISRIDFMLLHNLFRLAYIDENVYDFHDYEDQPKNCINNRLRKVNRTNRTNLITSSNIGKGWDVTNIAGNAIYLKPGFQVSNCSNYLASVTGVNNCKIFQILPAHNSLFLATSPRKSALVKNDTLSVVNETKSLELSSKISIYPNPTNDILFIEGISNFDVIVFDLSGRKLLDIAKANGSIDVSSLSSGIYMLHLKSAGKTYIQKIVKQ